MCIFQLVLLYIFPPIPNLVYNHILKYNKKLFYLYKFKCNILYMYLNIAVPVLNACYDPARLVASLGRHTKSIPTWKQNSTVLEG